MSEEKDTKEIERIVEVQSRNESPAATEKEEDSNETNLDKRRNKATGRKIWIFS